MDRANHDWKLYLYNIVIRDEQKNKKITEKIEW
jgi:hypothetical protein